jgi:Flp pilus assembly protein TadG
VLSIIRKLPSFLAGYANDRRAAISPMMVFLLIPLCGIMALAGEVSFWFVTQRALQNAADSAALAAAANNDETTEESGGSEIPRYEIEALAVARAYGFANGENNVTVTTTREEPCLGPDTEPVCYRVVIRRDAPLYLTTLVGYQGDVTHDGRFSKIITSEAVATRPASSIDACIIALGTTAPGLVTEGASTGFDQCDFVSNYEVKCTSVEVGEIYAPSVHPSCDGEDFTELSEPFPDPFGDLDWASLIPSTNPSDCLNSSTSVSNADFSTGPVVLCNSTNATLVSDKNITTPNSVLVLNNQTLNLNGKNLRTSGNGSLTIIFTAPSGTPVPVWFTNSVSGTAAVEIAGPGASSDGDFANFTLIQDPRRSSTSAQIIGDQQSGPRRISMNILGIIYAPSRDLTSSGNVTSDLNGYTCLSIIGKSFDSNGGKLMNDPVSECGSAGFNPPDTPAQRTALVR